MSPAERLAIDLRRTLPVGFEPPFRVILGRKGDSIAAVRGDWRRRWKLRRAGESEEAAAARVRRHLGRFVVAAKSQWAYR